MRSWTQSTDKTAKGNLKKSTLALFADFLQLDDVVELDLIGSDDVDGHIHLVISD